MKNFMQIMNTITPDAIRSCVLSTLKRFPVTIGYTALFTLVAMTFVWHPDLMEGMQQVNILAFLFEGALLGLAMQFWDECTGKKHLWQQVVGHVALLALAIEWYVMGSVGMGLVTAHIAIVLNLIMACVFLPFSGEKDEIPVVNFVSRLIATGIKVPLVGLLPTVLLCGLITASFPVFFDITASPEDYLSIVIFFQIVFPVLLFLSRVVKGKHMTNRKLEIPSYVRMFTSLLIVAVIVYMCILYCYECHIALAWELPNGGVSYLVAVMMGMCLLLEIFLYFIRHDGNSHTSNWFLRWMPLFMMPLLILMTIGICRRISDYGITTSRLYLATLNVWFYVVCIIMLKTNVRRIHWIPISFCVVFALVSVLPINFNFVARNYIYNDIRQKQEMRDKMNEKELEDLREREVYLRDYYGIDIISRQNPSSRDSIGQDTLKECPQPVEDVQ